MQLSLQLPKRPVWEKFLEQQTPLPCSYLPVNGTKNNSPVEGYDNDYQRVVIGKGDADFQKACAAIRRWEMFPRPWTKIFPENAPIAVGTVVGMYARLFGLWWGNSCRLVYTVDEPGRFGFAYGTLPAHVESGEELFLVEMATDGSVFYEIKAFSRPRHWTARLGYPLVRHLQSQFRQDSAGQMRNAEC